MPRIDEQLFTLEPLKDDVSLLKINFTFFIEMIKKYVLTRFFM